MLIVDGYILKKGTLFVTGEARVESMWCQIILISLQVKF